MTELEYLTCIANSIAAERQCKSIAEIQAAASSTKKTAHTTDNAERKPST